MIFVGSFSVKLLLIKYLKKFLILDIDRLIEDGFLLNVKVRPRMIEVFILTIIS